MKLILDNNILFSLMNPDSMNSSIFRLLNTKFFAPFFIINEFEKHEKECMKKSKLKKTDFKIRKKEVFSRINFVKLSLFKSFIKIAKEFCPDENDVFYFALCLKLDFPLWSNDRRLKEQDKVAVLDTKDIIEMFLA